MKHFIRHIINYFGLKKPVWDGECLKFQDCDMLKQKYGTASLCLKAGKTRLFVKGILSAEVIDDSPEYGLDWEWTFVPKDKARMEKLLAVIHAQDQAIAAFMKKV